MQSLKILTASWAVDGIWKIAPAGLAWIVAAGAWASAAASLAEVLR